MLINFQDKNPAVSCIYFSQYMNKLLALFTDTDFPILSWVPSFSFWRTVRSYRRHLMVRNPIWGDVGRTAFIRRTPGWGFQRFPQEIFAQPPVSLLSLAERRDWHDTRGKWPLTMEPDRNWWHRYTSVKLLFGRSPWLHGQQALLPLQLHIYISCYYCCCSSVKGNILKYEYSSNLHDKFLSCIADRGFTATRKG
jgi:hypothetical protein